jgi:GntR family transcriptional regulator, transcriptional repressor for pyruvate dehydrogenase complex
LRDTHDEIDDLWEYREIMETNIASLAARRRSEAELQAIDTAWAGAAESHTEFLRWNVVFHDALATAAHSFHLAEAMLAVRRELFLPVGLLLRRHRAEELRDSHTQVHEAVRDQRPDEASEAMRNHLAGTRLMVSEVLKEALDPSRDA